MNMCNQLLAAISTDDITKYVGYIVYLVLLIIALWGAFCVVMVIKRVSQKRFKSEEDQEAFLDAVELPLARGNFDGASEVCAGYQEAMCQLVEVALNHRHQGFERTRQHVIDEFQNNVMGDLEHRLNWVNTVIKAAPMIGLFGTVIGMMGAFQALAGQETVDPTVLAENIFVALFTTAGGLAIAIPLVLCTASVNVRIRKLEDSIGIGLTRFFQTYREVLKQHGQQGPSSAAGPQRLAEPANVR
jgi:biopolymer transport protein ExbB